MNKNIGKKNGVDCGSRESCISSSEGVYRVVLNEKNTGLLVALNRIAF